MMRTLRTDPHLAFLDSQFYLEWAELMNAEPAAILRPGGSPATFWLPPTEAERRAGFYYCIELLQMMEDAYVDLNLEEEFDHPENRGWQNCFRHWSASGMLRATWAIAASNFGARFQQFCKRRLDLDLGKVHAGEPFPLSDLRPEQRGGRLNYFEVHLINQFSRAYAESVQHLRVIPLQILVASPDAISPDDPRRLVFTFGFALAKIARGARRPQATLVYFRVQDHLRKMGLARDALRDLHRSYDLRVPPPGFKILDPARAASIQHILRDKPELREAFPTEQDMLRLRQLFESACVDAEN
jgi:hypothetical protein